MAATNPTAGFHRCTVSKTSLPELTAHGLPLLAIHLPAIGTISRKERDDIKAFGQERGLRVFDDPKRLEKDYPGPMAQVRERAGAAEDDLLMIAAWAGEPKGHRPEETVYQACRALATARCAAIQRSS